MAKTVIYDTLNLEGAEVRVDPSSGTVSVEVRYNVASTAEGTAIAKRRQVSDLLSQADKDAILDITTRLKQALEAQELA